MYGFIGGGNMATAIISGLITSGVLPSEIIVSDKNEETLTKLSSEFSVSTTTLNTQTAEKSEYLFICVKPNILKLVADEIKNTIKEKTVIISIVAGRSISILESLFGVDRKIIRVMPNTPAQVGEGMSAVCCNHQAEDDIDLIVNVFRKLGRCENVPENLFDTVTAVSGSSPAYVFMMIEAMADAAVQGGMPRNLAYTFAAQAVFGSAKMVLETGMHPGVLKDMVCSPGGTTIEAVARLEDGGFRNAIIKAMDACRNKSSKL